LLLLATVRKEDVRAVPLPMGDIVAEALERLTDLLVLSEAEVITPAVWPVGIGYAPWIEEVWVNYVSNAINYGGKPPRVELGADVQGDTVRFWIRDNGAGVPPEARSRLFTPFTRLSQARASGHGLGLSIVQRIISKLGGEVGVESHDGDGSLFYFTLPSADQ
jgi:signal transduction histidine kinase